MMRTVNNTMILFLIIAAAIGCENFYQDNDEYEESIAMVESFTIDSVKNKTASITFNCFAPTPCWHFSRVAEKRESNLIYLTVYRKARKYETCIQVVSSFKHSMNITVSTPGTYTLKIYRTNSTTTDTTITL